MAEPRKLEIRDIEIPEISEEEVLLKIEYAGICGITEEELKNFPKGKSLIRAARRLHILN